MLFADTVVDRLRRERYNRPPVIDGKGSFYKKAATRRGQQLPTQ
jgi:hypothetical protein